MEQCLEFTGDVYFLTRNFFQSKKVIIFALHFLEKMFLQLSWIEQRFSKPQVTGSNPVGNTKTQPLQSITIRVFLWGSYFLLSAFIFWAFIQKHFIFSIFIFFRYSLIFNSPKGCQLLSGLVFQFMIGYSLNLQDVIKY